MGRVHDAIDDGLRGWIDQQHVFFVSTAPLAADGHVNVSPKGLDSFRVLGRRRVAYLDLTGSGVETIAHVRENGRICVMFCAFDGPPRIVRFHGRGTVAEVGTPAFDELAPHFELRQGTRAIIDVAVSRIADSCGYAVPLMSFDGERSMLDEWAERRGPDGIVAYRAERNAESLDGLPGVTTAAVTAPPA